MKPPAFSYHAPGTLAEALALLAEFGSHAKVLAGGQSLIPLLNMRLAAPRHLVDLRRIDELDTVTFDEHGVRVGAMVRHARLEHEAGAQGLVLLATALQLVAHPVIRNRGTVVGSLAHADPSAELTAVLALLDGNVTVANAATRRSVAARDFFIGPLESCLRADELAVEANFPHPPPGSGTAFHEVSRRSGDYALCGVTALVTLDADGQIQAARLAYLSLGPVPRAVDVTAAVAGDDPASIDWEPAIDLARETWDAESDIHTTAAYRIHLATVLTRRALTEAAERATTPELAGASTHGPTGEGEQQYA